jgi:hypothetical protein
VTVTITTRDEALRRTGQVEDFRSLTMPLRFNRTSSWVLELDEKAPVADLFGRTSGVIIARDGVPLLSGPVTGLRRTRQGGRRTLIVNGVDDTVWLERRLALPVPSGPPYTAAAYDDRSGAAETVMRGYVNDNLGPGATAARRLPALTLLADEARGTSVRGRARFVTLLELLQALALAGGDLGFRIVQVGVGLQFQVYLPADRTRSAVFSLELGNLRGYDYAVAAPTADYVYVGGGGEGTGRVIVEGGDQPTVDLYGRVEVFIDRRDTAVAADLEQTRAETLLEQRETTSLSIEPVDTASVAFGRDYGLGDRVSVVIDRETVQDVVREVTLTLTREGERLTPVIGTPGASSPQVPALFDIQKRQARRLSQIERR